MEKDIEFEDKEYKNTVFKENCLSENFDDIKVLKSKHELIEYLINKLKIQLVSPPPKYRGFLDDTSESTKLTYKNSAIRLNFICINYYNGVEECQKNIVNSSTDLDDIIYYSSKFKYYIEKTKFQANVSQIKTIDELINFKDKSDIKIINDSIDIINKYGSLIKELGLPTSKESILDKSSNISDLEKDSIDKKQFLITLKKLRELKDVTDSKDYRSKKEDFDKRMAKLLELRRVNQRTSNDGSRSGIRPAGSQTISDTKSDPYNDVELLDFINRQIKKDFRLTVSDLVEIKKHGDETINLSAFFRSGLIKYSCFKEYRIYKRLKKVQKYISEFNDDVENRTDVNFRFLYLLKKHEIPRTRNNTMKRFVESSTSSNIIKMEVGFDLNVMIEALCGSLLLYVPKDIIIKELSGKLSYTLTKENNFDEYILQSKNEEKNELLIFVLVMRREKLAEDLNMSPITNKKSSINLRYKSILIIQDLIDILWFMIIGTTVKIL